MSSRAEVAKLSPASPLATLLAAVPDPHRRAVAGALGVPTGTPADSLAAALRERLPQVVAGLSREARAAASHTAVLHEDGVLHNYYGRSEAALLELERQGLAFAFGERYWRRWYVAQELRAPLARALAARHAEGLAQGRAKRWLAAPLQTAHDAAALWAFMHRAPVRVKADGDVYARFWPKLVAALPPLELFSDNDTLGELRLTLVLWFLRDNGFLRLRVDDRPGVYEIRRELVATGDLAAALAVEPETLRERLLATSGDAIRRAAQALSETAPGRTVSLAGFGAALRALLEEAGESVHPSWTDRPLALRGLETAWLAGAVELGADRSGRPVAARLAPLMLERPRGPAAVCQGNFELVLLRPPTPAERLAAELAAERVPGQAHVLRITRASVRAGTLARFGSGGLAEALTGLAGELPQNVARSIADWARGVTAPLRLRSALMVDAGDAETAAALAAGPLAGHVVERIGERLLAVRGSELADVERALDAAGVEVEPGLERVSGSWQEPVDRSTPARSAWAPRVPAEQEEAPGALASNISAPATPAPAEADAGDQLQDDEPLDVILRALEKETDVVIIYAGARGITHRQVTPLDLDDARLHAWCHLRGDARSFWLRSIIEARPAAA
jgi:hypothetical protein